VGPTVRTYYRSCPPVARGRAFLRRAPLYPRPPRPAIVGSPAPSDRAAPPVDVLMITFNSAAVLEESLSALRRFLPIHHLIVVDRFSTDGTPEIARRFGARVHSEESGGGPARARALELADTELALFVDSDVILRRSDFYRRAVELLDRPRTAAVVGNSIGHPFAYGLPLGLTLFRLEWGRAAGMASQGQGQETIAFRRAVRRQRARVRYVREAMEHHGTFRRVRTWPEWQGAQTRMVAGGSPYELAYSLLVILLIHLNSRSVRNIAYTPVFWTKFLRGYANPQRWRLIDRRQEVVR
jgi:glycosyltransferase involved in cell wall biosynthesis